MALGVITMEIAVEETVTEAAAVTEAAIAARRGVPVAPSTLAVLAKAGDGNT